MTTAQWKVQLPWRFTLRAGRQVETLQVTETTVCLVHSAKDKHVVSKSHSRVTVSMWRTDAVRFQLPPLVRDEDVLNTSLSVSRPYHPQLLLRWASGSIADFQT